MTFRRAPEPPTTDLQCFGQLIGYVPMLVLLSSPGKHKRKEPHRTHPTSLPCLLRSERLVLFVRHFPSCHYLFLLPRDAITFFFFFFYPWVGALENLNSPQLPCLSTLLRSRTSTSTSASGAQAAPRLSRSPQGPGKNLPGSAPAQGRHRHSAGRPLLGASPGFSRGTGERRKPAGPSRAPLPASSEVCGREREPAWDRGEAVRLHATLRAPLSGLCAPLAARPRPRPRGCAVPRGSAARSAPGLPPQRLGGAALPSLLPSSLF